MFVTFRLYDSLPANHAFPASNLTSGEAFVAMDRLLDQARSGPMFLSRTEIAELVLKSLKYGAAIGNYELHAWGIMSNHVHLLITPHTAASKLLCSLKRTTARQANLLLGRTGKPFWQDESYDHLVRNSEEYRRIRRYIENNPVKAGLVVIPEEYPWSSARQPARPPQAASLPHLAEA